VKTPGKTRPKPASATRLTEFRIDRGNPDDGANPHIDAYFVDRGD
jgi:succinate dehydrogenase / fumarate reductase iron-sulfur subunit